MHSKRVKLVLRGLRVFRQVQPHSQMIERGDQILLPYSGVPAVPICFLRDTESLLQEFHDEIGNLPGRESVRHREHGVSHGGNRHGLEPIRGYSGGGV